MHRLAEILALDIPQGLIDSAQGRQVGDAAPPEILPVHDLPEVLNPPRILPDQQNRQVLHGPGYRLGFPFQGGLAPSIQSRLASIHPDEDPISHAGVHHQR
jgi:hypothetical protein